MSEDVYFVAAVCKIIGCDYLYDDATEDHYKLEAISELLGIPCYEKNNDGFLLDFQDGIFYLLYVLIDRKSDNSLELRIGKENFHDFQNDIKNHVGDNEKYLDLDDINLYVFHYYNGVDRPSLIGEFIS